MSEVLLKNREHTPGGIREMLAIALPMVISYAADTVMTFTDRMFLSRLGPEVMNAAMGGGLTAFMMSTFFLGLIGYSTALVAQYLGANRKSSCPTVKSQELLPDSHYPGIDDRIACISNYLTGKTPSH